MSVKISSTSSAKGVSGARKASSASQSSGVSFSSLLEGASEVSENAAVTGMNGVSGVEAIFLAQSVGDAASQEAKKRRAVERGENILDKLEEVRDGLLNGTIQKEKLIALAQMLRDRREDGLDAKLNALLDEIEQRAEIELAKLTRA